MTATTVTYRKTWYVEDEGPIKTMITARVDADSDEGDYQTAPSSSSDIKVESIELMMPDGTSIDITKNLSKKALQSFSDWVKPEDLTEFDRV